MPGTHPKPKKKWWKYRKDQIAQPIEDVESGLSLRKSSTENDVSLTTVIRVIKNARKKEKSRSMAKKQQDSCKCFLHHHPDLHLKNPKPLEISRAATCREEIVFAWFGGLDEFLVKEGITSPDQLFNCDESGFPLQACSMKTVGVEKMVKRAFHLANSFKTSIATLQCISASGSVLPRAVFFPGKSLNPEYCLGFPRNVFLGFSDNESDPPFPFAPSKMFEAGPYESEIQNDGAGVITATAEPTAEPSAVYSKPPVATSTPVKAKADDRHTVLKSLAQLESIAGVH
eukprot:gene1902-2160_t